MFRTTNIEKTIEILQGLGFTLLERNEKDLANEFAFMDSKGEDEFGPVVQAFIYPNCAGTFSIDLDGGFKAPAKDNEEMLVEYLNTYFPGWNK